MAQARIVACMKWGAVFTPDYVNVLYNAVRDNLSGDFTFVCVTNESEGLHPDIEVRPIPEMNIPDRGWSSGAWPKVSLLSRDLFPETARVLFLDLDLMINGSLDEFFEPGDGFYVIGQETWDRKPRRKPWLYRVLKPRFQALRARLRGDVPSEKPKNEGLVDSKGVQIGPNLMNTSVFAFDAGAYHSIWEQLQGEVEFALRTYDNEQHYIEHNLPKWTGWRRAAVMSFKYNLRQPIGVDIFRKPPAPPSTTPVLAFHGNPRPHDFATKRMSSRAELPHIWFGPVEWFRRYWLKHNRVD